MQDVNRAEADLRQIESRAKGSAFVPRYHEFVSASMLSPVEAEHRARNQARAANAGQQ